MAENHCPPHFLHPSTNQIFQQISFNNFQIPNNNNNNNNNIPQQLDDNNQITQLGFGQFYRHDQEQQQQRRGWVDLPSFPVNFGVGQNGNYGKGEGVLGEEGGLLLMRGSEQFVVEGGNSNLTLPQCWRNQGDSPIKQPLPYGRSHLTDHMNENNKRSLRIEEIKEELPEQNQNKHFKCSAAFNGNGLKNNCIQDGNNVEAIYRDSTIDKTNETCQESVQDQLKAIASSDEKLEDGDVKNKKEEEDNSDTQLESSMVAFFNRLMNQVMHHQESLHQRFLQTIERLDEERKEREETWRKQDLARLTQQKMDRAHEQALASSREATIVSYLEKISGQNFMIPRKIHEVIISGSETMNVNKRWPKIEVEALIKFRTGLEPKFHDLALKAFVWEEISKLMGSMGYRRSAQRCKEKWENINRYYKKVKVQNPHKRKNCPYFQQLDEFYSSKSFVNGSPSSSSSFCSLVQGRNLLTFGNVEDIQEKGFMKSNDHVEGNKDKDEDEDEDEEEDEGSDAD